MTDPLFMSADHVAVMNQRLTESDELKSVAAALPRTFRIAYRLQNDRANRTEHWVMQLGPDGVTFSLDPSESADLTFVGDYWQMIAASRGQLGEGDVGLQEVGDVGVLAETATVFAAAQRIGAVPVSWPE